MFFRRVATNLQLDFCLDLDRTTLHPLQILGKRCESLSNLSASLVCCIQDIGVAFEVMLDMDVDFGGAVGGHFSSDLQVNRTPDTSGL